MAYAAIGRLGNFENRFIKHSAGLAPCECLFPNLFLFSRSSFQ